MFGYYFYVHFYYKMHIEKHGLRQYGDRFTFTICSHFRRIGIVVPHNSHAIKSTPTPKTPQNHSTHIFGQNLTIPYPNSHLKSAQNYNKTNYLHTLSHSPYLLHQVLINPTQTNKISPKTLHHTILPHKTLP